MKLGVLGLLCVVSVSACGKHRPDATTEPKRELITAEEIEGSNARDAYDAIRKLRANFLSYRGRTSVNNTSTPEPIVYVDDQLYGPLSSLRTIPAGQIETIRLYRAWEATSKYGTGHMGGVIAVYTRQ